MKKIILTLLVPLIGLTTMATTAKADCGEVVVTEMNWASAAIMTAIAKFIMEQGYGCTVQVVPSATVTSIASVAETGKPDIIIELWQNGAPLYPELEKQGKIQTAAQVLSDGGEEGWWIPQYLADKHPELTTIAGVLANPEKVGSRFHNCPEGWGCRITNDNLKVAYDLEGNGIKVFDHGSGETLGASIASAYADKKPWFGYYWAPTAILGKYPMAKVDMGSFVESTHSCNATSDCTQPGKSAYPAARVLTAVTTDFSRREPAVYELMTKMSYTNKVMNEVLAWKEDNDASNGEAAAHFFSSYKSIWKEWLNDSAKSKLARLLR